MCVTAGGKQYKRITGWKIFEVNRKGNIVGLCHQLNGTTLYQPDAIYTSVPGAKNKWNEEHWDKLYNPGFQGFVRKSDAMAIAEYWRQRRAPMYIVLKVVFYDAQIGEIASMTKLANGMKGISGKKMCISNDPGVFYVGISPDPERTF